MDKILLLVGGYLALKYYGGIDLLSYFTGSSTIPTNSTFNPNAPITSSTNTVNPTTTGTPGQTQPTGAGTPATTPATQGNNPTQGVSLQARVTAGMQQVITDLQNEGYTSFGFNIDQWNDLMRTHGGLNITYPSPEQLLMNDRNATVSYTDYLNMLQSWVSGGYGSGMGNISIYSYGAGEGGSMPMERLTITTGRFN